MNNNCEAVRELDMVGSWWLAKYAGEILRDKNNNYRRFKTEKAAMKAAYLARDGKDNRPLWRRK